MAIGLPALGQLGMAVAPAVIGAIAGRRRRRRSSAPGYNYNRPGPFEFNLDENDPELEMMRRNVALGGQRAERSSLNEVARAGQLGTSMAYNQQRDVRNQTERNQMDVLGSVYGQRRGERHGDWMQENQNEFDLSRMRYGAELGGWSQDQGYDQQAYYGGQEALGGLSGSLVQDWYRRNLMGGGGGNTDPYYPQGFDPQAGWDDYQPGYQPGGGGYSSTTFPRRRGAYR